MKIAKLLSVKTNENNNIETNWNNIIQHVMVDEKHKRF